MNTTSPLRQALLLARLRSQDRIDALAMSNYARAKLSLRGRMMILSGLAGFNRNVTGG